MTHDEWPLLVTRKEAARILGVSAITMRRLEGKSIEPVRLRPNGKVFYRLADVLALTKPVKAAAITCYLG